MTVRSLAAEAERRRGAMWPRTPIRVAVLDDDSGFLRVLAKRLETRHWECHAQRAAVPIDALVAMRPHALAVDPSLARPAAWSYLEALCARRPDLDLIVCTRPASVSGRVRGLRLGADDSIAKPCHPEELITRVEAIGRRRKPAGARAQRRPAHRRGPRDPRRPFPGVRPRHVGRSRAARVRAARAARRRTGRGPGARGDLPACVGLPFAAEPAQPRPLLLVSREDMERRRDELLEVIPS
jgi:ActR/RegA family two-component response regulator